MEKIEYSQIDTSVWDEFVLKNDFGWYYHTSSYINSLSWLGINESFAIADKGDILAIFTIYRQTSHKKKLLGFVKKARSNLQSLGGFVIKNGLTEKQKNKVYDFFKQVIDDMVKQYGVKKFWTTTATLAPAVLPEAKINGVNPLMFWGFLPEYTFVKTIDLRNIGVEDIFKQCNETTRQEIRKISDDTSYSIREAQPTSEDVETFYNLHLETYKRTGAAPFPKSYFEELFFNAMPKGFAKILFLLKDGEVISSDIILIYKNCGKYLANASKDSSTIKGNRYLLYKQILAAKQAGCNYFEVGGVFPYERAGKLKGLTVFKNSFGGFYYPVFEGTYVKQSDK